MTIGRNESVSIIVGSLLLGLIKTMDKSQQVKGSTIAYTNTMRTKIYKSKATQDDRKILSEVARDSMMMLVEQFEDQKSIMQVATFVESISFSFNKELTEFFGKDYITRMIRFTEKQIVESELAGHSYELSDQLRNNIRKIIFDRLKNQNLELKSA